MGTHFSNAQTLQSVFLNLLSGQLNSRLVELNLSKTNLSNASTTRTSQRFTIQVQKFSLEILSQPFM